MKKWIWVIKHCSLFYLIATASDYVDYAFPEEVFRNILVHFCAFPTLFTLPERVDVIMQVSKVMRRLMLKCIHHDISPLYEATNCIFAKNLLKEACKQKIPQFIAFSLNHPSMTSKIVSSYITFEMPKKCQKVISKLYPFAANERYSVSLTRFKSFFDNGFIPHTIGMSTTGIPILHYLAKYRRNSTEEYIPFHELIYLLLKKGVNPYYHHRGVSIFRNIDELPHTAEKNILTMILAPYKAPLHSINTTAKVCPPSENPMPGSITWNLELLPKQLLWLMIQQEGYHHCSVMHTLLHTSSILNRTIQSICHDIPHRKVHRVLDQSLAKKYYMLASTILTHEYYWNYPHRIGAHVVHFRKSDAAQKIISKSVPHAISSAYLRKEKIKAKLRNISDMKSKNEIKKKWCYLTLPPLTITSLYTYFKNGFQIPYIFNASAKTKTIQRIPIIDFLVYQFEMATEERDDDAKTLIHKIFQLIYESRSTGIERELREVKSKDENLQDILEQLSVYRHIQGLSDSTNRIVIKAGILSYIQKYLSQCLY